MSFNYDQFDVLHNFISPVTGRILSDFNYVLVGNKLGIAIPSPILIDIRLDLIALRKRYNSLVKGDILIGHPNNELPNAQVLINLGNGYLYTTDGVVSVNTLIPIEDLPDLPYQNIWIGDITNRPVATQRVGLENLPSFRTLNPFNNFGLYNLYTGQFSVFSPLQVAQPSITQRIDMSNMPHLSKGKMWIGKINYIPPYITIDTISPYIHVVGSLNWSRPGLPPGDGDGVPTEIGLNPGEIFIGNTRLGFEGQITTTTTLFPTNLPNLTYKAIWRGDSTNRPVEVFDLSVLETRMTNAENSIIALQGAVGQLEVQFGALQLQVGALDTALGLLTLEVQAIATTVAGLVVTVTGLGITVAALGVSLTALQIEVTNLSNRTLDQVPLAVADVSLNNHKITNLYDAVNPQDAVNLRTMQAAITAGAISSVTGTANQITANTVAGAVTLSLPTDVIITTSLSVGNLELVGNTLISTNSNGNITLTPNGTGSIDASIHKIINLSNPINPLDAVNLQTMQAAITAGAISSVTGTANQITVNTVAGAVTVSLPAAVIISTSLTAGNLELVGNTLISTNSNGNITLNPNGTGSVDVNNHKIINLSNPTNPLDAVNYQSMTALTGRTLDLIPLAAANVDINNHKIINLSNPINPLDAVNLQTMQAAITAGAISSITGTANQITANTVAGAVTVSLPAAVIISTSLTAGNLELVGNTLISTNTNGNITLTPNGTGSVDVNNHKIINLSNPANPLDAVNLQTMQAAITAGAISSITGTANQITANTVAGAVTVSLPAAVIISTSLTAGNLELIGNTLISTNTNGNITLTPNGTGNIDASTHKIINVSNPTNPLDAVNLQTMQAAIVAGSIVSVTGTANQITANTVAGAVTVSLPSSVVITTSVTAGNMQATGNILQNTDVNGNISIAPNGSGNLLLIPSPSTGLVGIKGAPSYTLDVFGAARVQRVMGTAGTATATAGVTSVTGTGRTISIDGSETGGSVTIITGTGISTSSITNPILTIVLSTTMPSSSYSVVMSAGNANVAALPFYIIKTTNSQFTVRSTTILTNSVTYIFNFHVIGNT